MLRTSCLEDSSIVIRLITNSFRQQRSLDRQIDSQTRCKRNYHLFTFLKRTLVSRIRHRLEFLFTANIIPHKGQNDDQKREE